MLKKILYILFLAFNFQPVTFNLLAQSISWQRMYRNPIISGDDDGFDGCAADGSNFYAVGSSASGNPYFYVLKLTQNGDTIWTRTFGQGGRALSVTPSGDGGCVFTGLRGAPFSIKVSVNGNVEWDKTYNNGGEAHDIVRTNDSGYVICGGFFSGYLCKIDTGGNLQWEKFYDDAPQDFHTIELALDGGYIVGGRKLVASVWKAYLAKIDGAGNIIWENSYNQSVIGTSIVKMVNGYFYISSVKIGAIYRVVLMKTDLAGNLVVADTLTTNSLYDFSAAGIKINNNKFAICFYSEMPPPNQYIGKIMSVDSNLNVIKQLSIIPDTNSLYLRSLIKAPGSNVDDIICIGSAEPNSLGDLDVYLARVDSSLSQPPPISVTPISGIVPEEFELFQNYPNPFNPETEIKFSIPQKSFVEVKIYNILGSEAETLVKEDLPAGNYHTKWNAAGFSSGIYFVTLLAGSIKLTKKLVLIK